MSATTIDTIYECSPNQIAEYIEECFFAGLVPFVKSSPGMGKSAIYRKVAKKLRLFMIDHRLSTSAPEDMTGLPGFENGRAKFHPFEELFPLEGAELPAGYDGWLIFLDEVNSAPKSVEAAAYKLVLDRQVGQHRLHERVVIGMAGNNDTDGAIARQMGTAMRSRVVTLRMRLDFDAWLNNVAVKENYDHRIVAYLNYRKDQLMQFDPKSPNDTFACPRTWEFMNALVKDKPILDNKIPLYAGTIGSGTAVDFVQYTKVYDTLITIEQVVRNPLQANLPDDKAKAWATTMYLVRECTVDNFEDVAEYMDRMALENRILFYRSILANHPKLHGTPAFIRSMSKMSKYLNPADQRVAA